MSALAALLAGAAVLVLATRAPAASRLRPPRGGRRPGRAMGPRLASAAAGLALAVLLAAPVGPVAGAVVAFGGPVWLGRLEPRARRRDREQLVRDLPLALELLAACLAGGADPGRAATSVAAAVPGPCGRRLAAVAAALHVGTSLPEAWALLAAAPSPGSGADDDPLLPVARLLRRASEGGAAVAPVVVRLAADARAQRRGQAERAARRVGVLVVGPLGLCFLPAFVLIGVVPVVLGLIGPALAVR